MTLSKEETYKIWNALTQGEQIKPTDWVEMEEKIDSPGVRERLDLLMHKEAKIDAQGLRALLDISRGEYRIRSPRELTMEEPHMPHRFDKATSLYEDAYVFVRFKTGRELHVSNSCIIFSKETGKGTGTTISLPMCRANKGHTYPVGATQYIEEALAMVTCDKCRENLESMKSYMDSHGPEIKARKLKESERVSRNRKIEEAYDSGNLPLLTIRIKDSEGEDHTLGAYEVEGDLLIPEGRSLPGIWTKAIHNFTRKMTDGSWASISVFPREILLPVEEPKKAPSILPQFLQDHGFTMEPEAWMGQNKSLIIVTSNGNVFSQYALAEMDYAGWYLHSFMATKDEKARATFVRGRPHREKAPESLYFVVRDNEFVDFGGRHVSYETKEEAEDLVKILKEAFPDSHIFVKDIAYEDLNPRGGRHE